MSIKRIDQFHPTIVSFDAIGNELLALHALFAGLGIESRLWACAKGGLDGVPVGAIQDYTPSPGSAFVAHYSISSEHFHLLRTLSIPVVLVYHNVTPPRLLAGASTEILDACLHARETLSAHRANVTASVCHSEFSARDLLDAGFAAPEVVPYLHRQELLQCPPSPAFLQRLEKTGRRTLLHVGRIFPNKCLEDSLLVFDHLQRISADAWQYLIVGSSEGADYYHQSLIRLCEKINLQNVFFLGALPQGDLNACYRSAEALLTMSRHEGFGVPLFEACFHGVPVVALSCGAVPEILGDGGVLFEEADHYGMAWSIDRLAQRTEARALVVERQRARAAAYMPAKVQRLWLDVFRRLGVVA